MFDSRRLGAALREARMEKNYTQEYLAELLNITPTHMKHIESGHRKPSIEVYFKMVEVLGFSTDNFCWRKPLSRRRRLGGTDPVADAVRPRPAEGFTSYRAGSFRYRTAARRHTELNI